MWIFFVLFGFELGLLLGIVWLNRQYFDDGKGGQR